MFYPTLVHDTLTLSARNFPDKAALICGKQSCTYRQLDESSNQLSRRLIQMGLRRGDRVIIFLENSIESVIALYGILKAGGVFVMLNGGLKADKLSYIAQNADACLFVTSRPKLDTAKQAADNMENISILCTGFNGADTGDEFVIAWERIFDESSEPVIFAEPLIDQDLATLIYTSGSTGQPKGIMSPHAAVLAAARSIIQYLRNTPDDIILSVLPLSFDYGLYQVLMSVTFGGTVVLEKSFTYIHPVLQRIAEHQVTGFPIVPTIVAMLLNMQRLDQYDFSSLRYISNTGAALPVEHIRRFRALFPDVDIYSMFGLTECKRTCYLPPEQIDIRPASVGKAIPNCRTMIVDEDGAPLPPGQIGELVIMGANVMAGYWKDPELTAKTYRPGPLHGKTMLYSGDYFKQDEEGFLYFLGRKDDMIKTRGERVSPKEIENTLSRMPGVAEVAVIGVPDDMLGQVAKAFIVRTDQAAICQRDVLLYASQKMENFMVPKYVEFLSALPKTPNGKIDKKTLKNQGG